MKRRPGPKRTESRSAVRGVMGSVKFSAMALNSTHCPRTASSPRGRPRVVMGRDWSRWKRPSAIAHSTSWGEPNRSSHRSAHRATVRASSGVRLSARCRSWGTATSRSALGSASRVGTMKRFWAMRRSRRARPSSRATT